jgi:cell division protein FtsQ
VTTATRPKRGSGARAARRLARAPRRPSPRARRRLFAAGIGALAVIALYLFVVRDLRAFAIETVSLSGASSGYGPKLEADLDGAARTMTTLHVDEGRLRELAKRYPAVVSLEADADLPDHLSIRVVEKPPVGTVEGDGGRRVPVAADGTLLDGQPVDRPLPALEVAAASDRSARRADRVAAARVAAGAPGALAAWVAEVRRGEAGWVAKLRGGPDLRFGSLADLPAKWSAAAAVLRAPGARGAGYVDLRLPDRPAAGNFPPRPGSDSPTAPSSAAGGDAPPSTNPRPELEDTPPL